jgi:predicted transcriptional regulator
MDLAPNDIQSIFNLSPLETEVLGKLRSEEKSITIKELIHRIPDKGKNLYRPVKHLVKIGLVEEIHHYPRKYSTRNFELKVKASIYNKINALKRLVPDLNSIDDSIQILANRTEYKDFGKAQMQMVQNSLQLLVSGSPQKASFFAEHIKLAERGVKIQWLVTNYKEAGHNVYNNLKRNGIEVRKKSIEGINVIIYDSKVIQMAIKTDPKRKEKIGIVIKNEFLVKFLKSYFEALWSKAESI